MSDYFASEDIDQLEFSIRRFIYIYVTEMYVVGISLEGNVAIIKENNMS